jgi:hypothetical protein
MKQLDVNMLALLFVIGCVYLYENSRPSPPVTATVLGKTESLYFEIFEIVFISILILLLAREKRYVLAFVFLVQLLEHFRQITLCYRQNKHSLHILTILLDFVFLVYAYQTKCFWIIPIFLGAIVIHISAMVQNKAFTDVVCIKS